MDNVRLEVLTDQGYVDLDLLKMDSIKYNKISNKISSFDNREISHSNTFSLLFSENNIKILNLNIFNKRELASSLNKKREANYYINGTLTQRGFLIINNILDGSLNVNFIDKALSLVSVWNSTKYKDLLESTSLPIPSDFQAAIDEMKTYQMPKNAVLSKLSDVGARGYKLAMFPSNLNVIGEEWQLNASGTRPIDSFNPYQSRPIFNAKAFLDIVCETFGYDPIYDTRIDVAKIQQTYITPNDTLKNSKEQEVLSVSNFGPVVEATPYYAVEEEPNKFEIWNTFDFTYLNPRSVSPSDVSAWITNPPNDERSGYQNRHCVYSPLLDENFTGYVNFQGSFTGDGPYDLYIYAVYFNDTNTDVVYDLLQSHPLASGAGTTFNYTVLKSVFSTPPAATGNLIGLLVTLGSPLVNQINTDPLGATITNLLIEEQSLIPGGVTYDEYGQFVPDAVDLTYITPDTDIKTILKGLLSKFGLLMDINFTNKQVEFFTYGSYIDKVNSDIYEDWSDYVINESSPNFNTDYGNDYAVINEISLKEPFLGNTFKKTLLNQGEDTKYKAIAQNQNPIYSDVENVVEVQNTAPYLEFTLTKIGLVEDSGVDNVALTQIRADGISQGSFDDLDKIVNVNYSTLDNGVDEWYNIIDNEIRLNQLFLLPSKVFLNFDIKKPIYLRQKGGFYIVEEIQEYSGSENVVQIKLIKLSTNNI